MFPRLFFDLDGLLAGFVQAALKLHNSTMRVSSVRWDFPRQMGFAESYDPTFWEPLSNVEFWANLPVLRDGKRLYQNISHIVRELPSRTPPHRRIGVLSSGECPGSVDGKKLWLKQHFPDLIDGHRVKGCFGSIKDFAASPDKVLIDDNDGNVRDWIEAGGRGVLVPRPWNYRAGECDADGDFDVEQITCEVLRAWKEVNQ